MNTLAFADYRSQKNNKKISKIACNYTVAIMAYYQAGWRDKVRTACEWWLEKNNDPRNHYQPEDVFYSFIMQKKYRESAAAALGIKYGNYPQEHWATLEQALNDFIGLNLCSINWKISMDKIQDYIICGCGYFSSGAFPGTKGHFVNVGGVEEYFVRINDPNGDFRNRYKNNDSGYGIPMTHKQFHAIMRHRKDGFFEGFIIKAKE